MTPTQSLKKSSFVSKTKESQRNAFLLKRLCINEDRRFFAKNQFVKTIYTLAKTFSWIVSYSSFRKELETQELNALLAKERRLLLPRIENDSLALYHIIDIEKQTKKNAFGLIEPDPQEAVLVRPKAPLLVLVPAVAFDQEGFRLGYGKGFYDRFLKTLSSKSRSCGIGFLEQKSFSPLPKEPHDIPVDNLYLF